MKRLCYILVLGLALVAQPVQADPITYDFHGVLAYPVGLPPGAPAPVEGPVIGGFKLDADADQPLVDFLFWIQPMGRWIGGSPSDPYVDVEQALANAPDGATLIFKAGSDNTFSATSLTISRPMTLKGADATIRKQ